VKQFHIQVSKGQVGRYVLMPGDPGRVPLIAALLDNAVHVASNREFVTYTGTLDGVEVSVTSTGIGTPSSAIAAIRHEGTSNHYMPIEFPAVCDVEIVQAMCKAVDRLELPHQVGISHSKDSYYGEVEPERSAVSEQLLDAWRAWRIGGAICSEMEISTICVVSSILGARAGGIMAMHGEGEFGPLDNLIKAAVESVRELISIDKKKGK
jgi:uridine phosphorylase